MPKEENMKISVQNYGPIAEAKDIELCPLTVFVGPSNTGKSYLAILIYALFNSFERTRFIPQFRRGRRISLSLDNDLNLNTKPMYENIFKFLKKISVTEKNAALKMPEELEEWIKITMGKTVTINFYKEISRCMGTSIKETLLTKAKFNLYLEDSQKKLIIRSYDENFEINLKTLKFPIKDFITLQKFILREKEASEDIKERLFLDFFSELIMHNYSDMESFYLPAARTGIMQSHRAMAGALVQRATFAGLQDFSVPALSGIVSDFLEEIILMDTGRILSKSASKVADEMEKNILKGSIKSVNLEANQYPQFIYKQNGLEVPLLRSSSMVSELAPLVLFIRHRVSIGDLLIIEEPEAHLHPEAQRNIAKTIVHLIRTGIKVMVTTHSDYFLEQLENYIRIAKLSADEREALIGSKDLFLAENEIGAYAFNEHPKGTIVKRLKFKEEDGLSPEDHNKVSSALYNETVNILDVMDNL